MTETIQREDVIKLANLLNIEATEETVNWVLEEYDNWEAEALDSIGDDTIENMLLSRNPQEELTSQETTGLIAMINFAISHRITDKVSDLSYLELINLKNKLQK